MHVYIKCKHQIHVAKTNSVRGMRNVLQAF